MEISEWLSKELTSFLINVPSRPVIIQSNGKDLTDLHKFLARAAILFLFRCSLPPFRHDPSIFKLSVKIHTCWVTVVFKFSIDIIDLIFKIFIFTVYYAREYNFYGVVFINLFYCTYQFLCLFYNVSQFLCFVNH